MTDQQGGEAAAKRVEAQLPALEIFERLGPMVEPDKVRAELAELPSRCGLAPIS